jgi:hypothetical protein
MLRLGKFTSDFKCFKKPCYEEDATKAATADAHFLSLSSIVFFIFVRYFFPTFARLSSHAHKSRLLSFHARSAFSESLSQETPIAPSLSD